MLLLDSLRELFVEGHAFLEHLGNGCIIRAMPTIDSDGCRPSVLSHADHPFRWDGAQFFQDAGIGGRLDSESVDGMLRNPEKKN